MRTTNGLRLSKHERLISLHTYIHTHIHIVLAPIVTIGTNWGHL